MTNLRVVHSISTNKIVFFVFRPNFEGNGNKFKNVNKSFNSFNPLLSKVLTEAREKSTTQIENLGNSVSRGQFLLYQLTNFT